MASSVWNWIQSHPWSWVQKHPWLSAIGAFLIGFGKKVWAKLEPKAVDFVAERFEHRVATFIAGYRKLYANHLYYKHRTFDVKGFSTQGKFALELENVYVDLGVDPAVVGTISQDPIHLPKDVEKSGDRSIFIWLNAEPDRPRNFAIIGPPGSGKTTLLKHLALLLSARKATVRWTPVLLFLRDHAAAIGSKPEIKLTELIEAALADLPPPRRWFQDLLAKGKCLIMLDGLDEVADPELRGKVVRWVERQVNVLGANRFLVSSRPNGYRDDPLSGFTALQVLPFNRDQVDRFVRNWYFANEIVAHQKNDPGVRMEADKGAEDLLDRLRRASTLQDLGVNPLLLTLIATVHRYRSQLPGRRVELFAEICDVFLGKRQQAKGLELDLTPAQKVRVLRVLAFEMMCREVRDIKAGEAAELIAPVLKLVMPQGEPAAFLRMIEDSSALLVQNESGVYGFAHLTFQEYLASFHIKEEKLVEQLALHVDRTWWHETARLYAAQADATPIVEKCLTQDRPPVEALLLATDCEKEALELRGDLRDRLRRITEGAVEDRDPIRRRQAAEYMLERRLRDMARVSDDRYIDRSPVTHAEYQLFVDEIRAQGKYMQPDHWNAYEFTQGAGRRPIVGLRKSDAEEFCDWLTERERGLWGYALPVRNELRTFCEKGEGWQGLRFFSQDEEEDEILFLSWQEIIGQIDSDRTSTTERAIHRLNFLMSYLARAIDRDPAFYRVLDVLVAVDAGLARAIDRASDLDIARGLALALARVILDRVRVIDFDSARASDLDLTLALDSDLARAIAIALARASDLDLTLALARALARAIASARASIGIASASAIALDSDRALALYMLNWFCVVEKRAEGKLPVLEGLWIARVRR